MLLQASCFKMLQKKRKGLFSSSALSLSWLKYARLVIGERRGSFSASFQK
jgi:hypothetical protein